MPHSTQLNCRPCLEKQSSHEPAVSQFSICQMRKADPTFDSFHGIYFIRTFVWLWIHPKCHPNSFRAFEGDRNSFSPEDSFSTVFLGTSSALFQNFYIRGEGLAWRNGNRASAPHRHGSKIINQGCLGFWKMIFKSFPCLLRCDFDVLNEK